MINAVFRTSHMLLALFSFVFLLLASVTGGLLAFEPIVNKTKSYQTNATSNISISDALKSIQKEEISVLKNQNRGHIVAAFENGIYYINPKTGKKLEKVKKQARFFKFLTKLHRSLFLKTIGRALVGIVSFLLFLIAITGTLLIIKRQKSVKAFFNKIVKESTEQYYHIVFGRLTLIPIVVVALSGTYLSLQRFKIIPKTKVKLVAKNVSKTNTEALPISEFSVFKNNTLANLKELRFPFSKEPNEFFHLKLSDRELLVNQFTGKIVSEELYPFSKIIGQLSFDLHTGYSGVIWAVIIMISSFSILYFMYSGFVMTCKRLRGRTKNKFKSNQCEYIILVGSENGSTQNYAKMLYKAFLTDGKKAFITTLNSYTEFTKMKHLIVLSATYGDGEAPSNASKFLHELKNKSVNNHDFYFTVVGFGSMSYPKFCQFAIDADKSLQGKKSAKQLLPLMTVNNKSFEQFNEWMRLWNQKTGCELSLDKSIINKRKKQRKFKIISRKIDANSKDDTFLLQLIPKKKTKFTSGDLLGVYANESTHERLYSIARINDKIFLSIKLHANGLCSNHLYKALVGSSISGFIQKNNAFHFPKKASKVIMIATGTGIAPFLGMIQENNNKLPIDLYFGIKTKKSLQLYNDVIHKNLKEKKVVNFYPAYSREFEQKTYVQNLIKKDIDTIIVALKNKAVIMLCGSIAMQKEVFTVLENALNQKNEKSFSFYKKANQILVDCY